MREPDKSRKSAWWRVRAACTAFGRDRDGSALFYTTISLPVLIGFAVLAIDGSRLMNLQFHLQHAADGLALAAAGELDRKSDACDRAVRALENLVENNQMFGDLGAATITIDDVTGGFLMCYPPAMIFRFSRHFEGRLYRMRKRPLHDSSRSRSIRRLQHPVSGLLPRRQQHARANATAVAGFDAAVCEFTPLFICNPWDKSIVDVIEDGDNIGKQIKFHMVPRGAMRPATRPPETLGCLSRHRAVNSRTSRKNLR
jgi:hypothetical protein